MIIEYHRPDSIKEMMNLLSRDDPRTVVLGGGLFLNEVVKDQISVADIQNLGLNKIKTKGKKQILGAGTTLQTILNNDKVSPVLKSAIKYQESYNRRQVATLAGTVMAATGRSAITAVLLVLDAEIEMIGDGEQTTTMQLGDFLPLREEYSIGTLITGISIPTVITSSFNSASRSPADLPIIAAAVSQWPSGRTRVVLAGYGEQPVMVLDGPNSEGAEAAAKDAYSKAGDQWASAEYRAETAGVLVRRCLDQIAENIEG